MTDGFHRHESRFDAEATMANLAKAVVERGLTIFLQLDHAVAAVKAGLTLRPTLLLVFGRAEGGTPLMQADQAIGVDLPLRALVWSDAADRTWIGYDDPLWIVHRHGVVDAQIRLTAGHLSNLMRACVLQASGAATTDDRGTSA